MAKLPSDDVRPNNKVLTRSQHKLLNEIRNAGGQIVVDGRRGSVAKALRSMGLISAHMRLEYNSVRDRNTEAWNCALSANAGLAALSADGGER